MTFRIRTFAFVALAAIALTATPHVPTQPSIST
jgi:hypothetical protein